MQRVRIGWISRLQKRSTAARAQEAEAGRGTVGKTAIAGIKDRKTGQIRAEVVDCADAATLQQFVYHNLETRATVYTDEATAYRAWSAFSMKLSSTRSVNGATAWPTNGLASFWATLKRAYHSVYHKMSRKHLQRYVRLFAQKHNVRDMDTREQMQQVVTALAGQRLVYKDLIEKCARARITKDALHAAFARIDHTPSPNPRYRGLTIQQAVRPLVKARTKPKQAADSREKNDQLWHI